VLGTSPNGYPFGKVEVRDKELEGEVLAALDAAKRRRKAISINLPEAPY
jgi:hypothetical protein